MKYWNKKYSVIKYKDNKNVYNAIYYSFSNQLMNFSILLGYLQYFTHILVQVVA